MIRNLTILQDGMWRWIMMHYNGGCGEVDNLVLRSVTSLSCKMRCGDGLRCTRLVVVGRWTTLYYDVLAWWRLTTLYYNVLVWWRSTTLYYNVLAWWRWNMISNNSANEVWRDRLHYIHNVAFFNLD
jgi:hypothetical protein